MRHDSPIDFGNEPCRVRAIDFECVHGADDRLLVDSSRRLESDEEKNKQIDAVPSL